MVLMRIWCHQILGDESPSVNLHHQKTDNANEHSYWVVCGFHQFLRGFLSVSHRKIADVWQDIKTTP